MNHPVWNCTPVLVLALLIPSPSLSQKGGKGPKSSTPAASPQSVPQNQANTGPQPIDYRRARKIVIADLGEAWKYYDVQVRPESIELTYKDSATGRINTMSRMELKTLQRVSVAVKQHDYVLLVNGKDDKSMSTYSLAFRLESYPSSNWGRSGDPQALAKAQAYADALNLLSAHARGEDRAALDAEWSDFQQKAVAWRSLPTKPAVSDAVRMHRIGAEEALQQKQFDTAIDDYEAGLKIDPLWPEGHFNAAILDGELNDYEWAVWHMRAYLELLPDAPDAPAAHDQLLLWQGKLGQ